MAAVSYVGPKPIGDRDPNIVLDEAFILASTIKREELDRAPEGLRIAWGLCVHAARVFRGTRVGQQLGAVEAPNRTVVSETAVAEASRFYELWNALSEAAQAVASKAWELATQVWSAVYGKAREVALILLGPVLDWLSTQVRYGIEVAKEVAYEYKSSLIDLSAGLILVLVAYGYATRGGRR